MEILNGDEWQEESTTGLLFYNYLGKRSEKIYQNKVLPPREQPLLRTGP